MTTLVTVAHGTRHPTGNDVARQVTAAVAERWSGRVLGTYVELCTPLYAPTMAELSGPLVVVPLLLSVGHHARHDLPAALPASAELTAPLGPDPLLAAAMVARLRQAGARVGQPVTMIAAGSRDPACVDDLVRARDLLAAAWGAPVRWSTLSGHGPRPAEVIRGGDAVVPYLLAPGHFATRAEQEARHAGAELLADVIGAHPAVVDLVMERARAGALSGSR